MLPALAYPEEGIVPVRQHRIIQGAKISVTQYSSQFGYYKNDDVDYGRSGVPKSSRRSYTFMHDPLRLAM